MTNINHLNMIIFVRGPLKRVHKFRSQHMLQKYNKIEESQWHILVQFIYQVNTPVLHKAFHIKAVSKFLLGWRCSFWNTGWRFSCFISPWLSWDPHSWRGFREARMQTCWLPTSGGGKGVSPAPRGTLRHLAWALCALLLTHMHRRRQPYYEQQLQNGGPETLVYHHCHRLGRFTPAMPPHTKRIFGKKKSGSNLQAVHSSSWKHSACPGFSWAAGPEYCHIV